MTHVKGGLVILKNMMDTLPPSERKIAQYIIANPEESTLLTAVMLGEKSKTSSAAVIRLCKSLGFNSFQELKISVAVDLQKESVRGYRDVKPNESYKEIIDKVTYNTIQTLKETKELTDINSLKLAVKALQNAESIVFIGFGASYIAAKDAEQKFLRINKNVRSFSDIHIAATSIANKGSNDVVVGISFSGQTKEAAKLLELANQKKCKTISITKYGRSLITSCSDIQLYTSSAREATFRSGATSSRIAQLHIIDILLMCLTTEDYETTTKYLDETRKAISYLF